MNKKGFTLIELLAVIVILAVIALITIPAVMNVVTDAKNGAIRSSTYGYISAVEKDISLRDATNGTPITPGTYSVGDFPNIVKGTKPTSGIIVVGESLEIEEAQICIYDVRVNYSNQVATIDPNNDCSSIGMSSSTYIDYLYIPNDGASEEMYLSKTKEVYISRYFSNRIEPIKVNGLTNVKKIYPSSALTETGELYSINSMDQTYELIENNVVDYFEPYIIMEDNTIKTFDEENNLVIVSELENAKKIITGYYFNAAVMNDGTVKAWGLDNYSDPYVNNENPTTISGLTNVKDLYFTEFCTNQYQSIYNCDQEYRSTPVFVIKNNGDVVVWGYNQYGILGLGHTSYVNTPTLNSNLSDIKEILVAGTTTYAVTNAGGLYFWGRFYTGYGSQQNEYEPMLQNLTVSIESLVPNLGTFYGEEYPTSLAGFMTTTKEFYSNNATPSFVYDGLWLLLQDGITLPANLTQYQSIIDCHALADNVYDGFSCYDELSDEEIMEIFEYFDTINYPDLQRLAYGLFYGKEKNHIVKYVINSRASTLDGVKYFDENNGTIGNSIED